MSSLTKKEQQVSDYLDRVGNFVICIIIGVGIFTFLVGIYWNTQPMFGYPATIFTWELESIFEFIFSSFFLGTIIMCVAFCVLVGSITWKIGIGLGVIVCLCFYLSYKRSVRPDLCEPSKEN